MTAKELITREEWVKRNVKKGALIIGGLIIAGIVSKVSEAKQIMFKNEAGTRTILGDTVKSIQMFGDFRGLYNVSADWILINLAQTTALPKGITITSIYLDCTAAAPTTQITGKLKYCDALAGGIFPGANQTDIATITTTTGNYASGAITTNIPASKIIYLSMSADPTDYNTTWNLIINYTVN